MVDFPFSSGHNPFFDLYNMPVLYGLMVGRSLPYVKEHCEIGRTLLFVMQFVIENTVAAFCCSLIEDRSV